MRAIIACVYMLNGLLCCVRNSNDWGEFPLVGLRILRLPFLS